MMQKLPATFRIAVLVCMLFPCVTGITAQEDSDAHGIEHRNEVAIFLGYTVEGRDEGSAMGLEYERRLSDSFGVGALVEKTWRGRDFWVYAVPLRFHLSRWKFVAAPGVEQSHGRTETLVRTAAGYEFEAGKVRITPTLAVDFVGGEKCRRAGCRVRPKLLTNRRTDCKKETQR